MNRSRVTGDLTASGLLYADIANDRVGIGSTIPGNKLSLPDGAKIGLGNAEDLTLYHDSGHSYINNALGDLVLKTTNDDIVLEAYDDISMYVQGASGSGAEKAIMAYGNGAVELYYNNTLRFATNSAGVTVSGNCNVQGGGITMQDTYGYYAGTGNDLSILHNATNSVIKNITGELRIQGDLVRIMNSAGSKVAVESNVDDNVELYFNNVKKFETSSAGATVTGALTATSFTGTLNTAAQTNITSVGTLTALTVSGQVNIPDSIVHSGNDNLKIRFPATDTFTVETAGSERFRITSTGSVGIGTNNPDVGNTAYPVCQVHGTSLNSYFKLTNSTTGVGSNDGVELSLSGSDAYLTNRESANIIFRTAATERLRIDSSGRLLLGTTTEGYSSADDLTIATSGHTGITIRSGTSNEGAIFFSDGTSGDAEYRGFIQYKHASDALLLATGGSERLRITSAGQLNIGGDYAQTDSKVTIIDATKPIAEATLNLQSSTSSGAVDTGAVLRFYGHSGTEGRYHSSIKGAKENGTSGNYAGYLSFNTRPNGSAMAERLRITSAGNVGINQTNPTEKLDVNGTIQCLNELRSTTGNDLLLNAGSANRDVKIQVNDVNMMYVQGSTGFIGIGTDNPVRKLHVEDDNAEIALYQSRRAAGSYVNYKVGANGAALGMIGSGAAILSGGADAGDFGIRAAGDLCISSGGHLERARFDTNGRLLIGHTASLDQNSQLQSFTTGTDTFAGFKYGNNSAPNIIRLGKSRNASVGGNTIVADDDEIGRLLFSGNDGSQFRDVAYISGFVDGSPSTGTDMPGRLSFWTSADGSSVPTERLRIDSNGVLTTKQSSTNATSSNWNGAIFSIQNTHDTDNNSSVLYFMNSATGVDCAIQGIHEDAAGSGSSRRGHLQFGTSGSDSSGSCIERLRIASDGKVHFGSHASVGANGYILKETSGDYKFNIFASSSTTTNRIITFNSRSNVEAMRIDSSGNVKIGDATTDYTYKLTVSGNASVNTGLFMYDGAAGTWFGIQTQAANGLVVLRADARSGAYPPLTFNVGGSERLRIASGGSIVVGDFTPVDTRNTGGIHIQPSKGIAFKAYSNSNSRNWRIRNDDAAWGNLDFGVGTSNSDFADAASEIVLSLANSRRVGIRNTAPQEMLHVGDGSGTEGGLKVAGQSSSVTDDGLTIDWTSSNEARLFSESSGNATMHFYTTNSGTRGERLRITSNGSLLLGGTADVTDLTGDPAGQRGLVIGNTGLGNAGIAIINSTTGAGRIYFGDATGSNAARNRGQIAYYHNDSVNSDYMAFATAAAERLRITSDGQIFIGGNTGYNESSALISFATDSSAGANMLSDSSTIYNHNNPAFIHVQNRYNTGTGQEAGIIFHSRSSHSGSWAIYGKRTSSSYLSDLIFRNRTGGSSSAERLRINSSGYVGINQNNPQRYLHITGNDGATGATLGNSDSQLVLDNAGTNGAMIEFLGDANGAGHLMFTDTGGVNRGRISYHHNGDYLRFDAGGAEKFRIKSDGAITHKFTGRNGQLIGSSDGSGAFITLDGAGNGDGSGSDYMYMEHASNGDFEMWNGNGSNTTSKFLDVTAGGQVRTPKQVSFAAYRSQSSWSVGNSSRMQFNATRHNVGNHFDTSNNVGRFTAPATGSYQFNFYSILQGSYTNGYVQLFVNGARIKGGDIHFTKSSGSNWDYVSYSQVLYLTTDQYVELFSYTGSSSGSVIWHGNNWQCFSGHLLG